MRDKNVPTSYLVMGYGETDYPEISIVHSLDEAKDAVVAMAFDPPSGASQEDRETLLNGFDDPDEWDGRCRWKVEFEIGGIEVTRVFGRHTAPKWIQVSERLPPDGRDVLVAGHRHNDVRNGYWQLVLAMMDGVWVIDEKNSDEWEGYAPTHWMPLPEPPKG